MSEIVDYRYDGSWKSEHVKVFHQDKPSYENIKGKIIKNGNSPLIRISSRYLTFNPANEKKNNIMLQLLPLYLLR